MNAFDLIAQSGPMAKLILLVLLGASVVTWALVVSKHRSLKVASLEDQGFLSLFWGGKSIEEVFQRCDKFEKSPVASVFRAGVRELKKLTPPDAKPIEPDALINVERSLERAATAEIAALEKHVSLLATVASAAPFVGLFGTVWGIMGSFQNIGATGAANLAVVAPGISEALITTATGIGAAIPAVIAYNFFASRIRDVATEIECFSKDFLNIIQRGTLQNRR